MWQRFTVDDIIAVAHYLGVLVTMFSVAMVVPLVTAVLFTEWEAIFRYLLGIGIALCIGTLLRMMRLDPGKMTHQQALAVTGFAWIILAVVASIPLFLSGHYNSYMDALFEGVSGLTTTGASLVMDLDHLSYADNMWRFTMHFIGGLGLIVIALSLGFMGRSSTGLYSSEGRSDHVVPNIVSTTRTSACISIIMVGAATCILSLICMFGGMEPIRAFLNALWVAISGFMTAGFTPTSLSIMYYHSYPLELVCMLLMILGSISFALFVEVWRGKTFAFFKDIEIRTALIWIIGMGFVFMAAISSMGMLNDLPEMLRRGVFMLVSAMTTTGFQNITSNQLMTVISSGALLTLALLMSVGGSSGSTAGGIKFLRLGLVAKSVISTVKQAIAPDTARVSVPFYHLGKHVLTADIVRLAMTVSALFIATYIAGSLVGIAYGYDATSSIFESIAMASNGGLSSGIITPGMPMGLEIFYLLEMWAGRLEFITLLALVVKIVVSLLPKNKKHFMDKIYRR